jgi:hypothetical protein
MFDSARAIGKDYSSMPSEPGDHPGGWLTGPGRDRSGDPKAARPMVVP